jgi:hypothetical protein
MIGATVAPSAPKTAVLRIVDAAFPGLSSTAAKESVVATARPTASPTNPTAISVKLCRGGIVRARQAAAAHRLKSEATVGSFLSVQKGRLKKDPANTPSA